jgi:hypothetical protein
MILFTLTKLDAPIRHDRRIRRSYRISNAALGDRSLPLFPQLRVIYPHAVLARLNHALVNPELFQIVTEAIQYAIQRVEKRIDIVLFIVDRNGD